jgi:hypothetical protein
MLTNEQLYLKLLKYEIEILRHHNKIEDSFCSIGLYGMIFDENPSGNYEMLDYVLDCLNVDKDNITSRDEYKTLYYNLYDEPELTDKLINKFLKDIIKLKTKLNKKK